MKKILKIFLISVAVSLFAFNIFNSSVSKNRKNTGLNNLLNENVSIKATSSDVAVEDIIVEEIESYVFEVGEEYQIKAEVSPQNATNKTLYFESSDPFKATVSQTGLVKFISPRQDDGKVTIRIYADNYKVLKEIIFQIVIPVESVSITAPASNVLPVGEELKLDVRLTPYNASNKNLIYEASNDSVTIENGVIKGVKEGIVRITVKSFDGLKEDYIDLIVGPHVEAVEITNEEEVLCVGKTLELNIVFTPLTAALKTYTITSSNTTIATIEDGLLKALKVGRVTITVITTDQKKSAQYSLMVKEAQDKPKEIKDSDIIVTDSKIVIENAGLNVEYMLSDAKGVTVYDFTLRDSNNRISFENLSSGKTYVLSYRMKDSDTKAASEIVVLNVKVKNKDYKKLPVWLIIIIISGSLGLVSVVLFLLLKKKNKND